MVYIGQRNLLSTLRETTAGVYLDGEEWGELLLPGRYIPRDYVPSEPLDVFVYRDSEDRLIATTEAPFAMVGDFACLEVVSVNRQIGAFLNWGLPKDLLLPFREQTSPVRAGDRVVVAVCLDPKTDRIIASARLRKHLSPEPPNYFSGQPVRLLIADRTPMGYNAIVENAHLGLLFNSNLATPLVPGQEMRGFVRVVREDGKIDLSLDASGYRRVGVLSEEIVAALEEAGGRLDFDDDSSPEDIRARFGVSKKAFKQALGTLYRQERIRFEKPGIQLLDNSSWTPGD